MKVWNGILAALVLTGIGAPGATAGINMQGVNMQGINMQGVNMQGARVNQLAAHPESTSTGLSSTQIRVVGGRLVLVQK